MLKKFKTAIAYCSAMLMIVAATMSANAANEVTINDSANVAVGDTFTYSMFISDAQSGIMGMQAYVFYDTDYLEIDTSSISFETLNGVIYNGNLDGYMTFNFSDINNYADFSSRSQLVSMNFKVKKAGNTNVRYFIKEMYDSNMVTLSAYTITYDIVYNEKTIVSDQIPVVEDSEKYINHYQGNFTNYLDGKGDDNTNEKSDHKAVIGEKTTMVPQNNQNDNQYTDVTQNDSGSSVTTIVIVCGCVLLAAAIAGVMYFRNKENKKNEVNTDSDNIDNDMP